MVVYAINVTFIKTHKPVHNFISAMAQKYQTPLTNFKFGRIRSKGTYLIDWFRYDLNQDVSQNVSGFEHEDKMLFDQYVVGNYLNFFGDKNVYILSEDELPEEARDSFVHNTALHFPKYFLLLPDPKIDKTGKVSEIMHIVLLNNEGKENHTYNLPFGVIGRIIINPDFKE